MKKQDQEAIERAMKDPTILAFLKIVGYLLPFSQRGRERILRFVADQLDEEIERERQ